MLISSFKNPDDLTGSGRPMTARHAAHDEDAILANQVAIGFRDSRKKPATLAAVDRTKIGGKANGTERPDGMKSNLDVATAISRFCSVHCVATLM